MSRKTLVVLTVCLLATASLHAAETAPETEDQKTLYAVGYLMSQRLAGYGLTADELPFINQGLADGALGEDAKVDLAAYRQKVDTFMQAKRNAAVSTELAENKKLGDAFREKIAQEPGAVRTDSGMIYIEQQAGTGASPSRSDTVKVHYHGTFTDGEVFDSSVERGQPTSFPLNGVVPCFSEGIQRMKVGGKSKLVCPPELAYGSTGSPPKIPAGATLIFEVELIEIAGGTPATP